MFFESQCFRSHSMIYHLDVREQKVVVLASTFWHEGEVVLEIG